MIYSFDQFEIDVENRTLRRRGTPVPMQDLPFDALCFLVRNAGLLVSRHELAEALWSGSFVDAEQGRAGIGRPPENVESLLAR